MTTTPTLHPAHASRPTTAHSDGSVFAGLLQRALGGVAALSIAAPAVAAFAHGERDPNQLADAVFYARHPELHGRRIAPAERRLVQEWIWIRDSVITPTLNQLTAAATAIATAPPLPPSTRFTVPPDPAHLLPPARPQIAAEPLFPGENVLAAETKLIEDVACRPDGWVYVANWYADLAAPKPPTPYVLQPFLGALSLCARSGGTIRALFWEGSLRDLASRVSDVMKPLDQVSDLLTLGVSPGIAAAQHVGVVPQQSAVVADAIRSIAHKQTNYTQNSRTASLINAIAATNHLPGARVLALLDDDTLTLGSHHQKIFVVGNSEHTVAVVGGFDLNPDRLIPIHDEPGTPYFDISVKVDGPAAGDIAEIFERRWNAAVLRRPFPVRWAFPLPHRALPTSRASAQGATVQVGVNYGCGHPMGDIPHAVRGANALIKNLLHNCRRFFYAEDQYGTGNDELRDGILQAFKNGASFGVVVLATSAGVTDTPEIEYWRYEFRRQFPQIDRQLLVFERLGDDSPAGPHAYVHSKFLLVDDEAASIASVNMNRRSWYNDSEIAAVLTDAPDLIRGLRKGTWASHLWGPTRTPWPQEEIADPMAGFEVWRAAHDGRRARRYLKPLTFALRPERRMPGADPKLEEVYRVLKHLPGGVAETIMTAVRDEIIDPQGPASC